MKRLYWQIGCIVIITLIAIWLRVANLGVLNLYNDEYYQFNTAVGYLKSGHFDEYNFYTQKLVEPYTRARIFTWQVAQSLKLFGVSETAARLPAVLWGILLIPLVMSLLWLATKNSTVAILTGVWLAFDNFMIDLSRFTRMYTMFFVFTIITLFLFYKLSNAKKLQQQIWYATGTLLSLIIAALTYTELTLALCFGLGVYIAWRGILFRKRDKLFWYGFLGEVGLALGLVVVQLSGYHLLPINAFIVGIAPHWQYIVDAFSQVQFPILAGIFAVIGIVTILDRKSFAAISATVVVVLLSYFVFFSQRYEAQRYIGFLIPLIYFLSVLGMYQSVQYFTRKNKHYKKYLVPAVIILALVIGPKPSWPGFHLYRDWIVQTAQADKTNYQLGRSNVSFAYQYVADEYQPSEVVLVQGLRSFYWPDRSIPVYELEDHQKLTYPQFQALLSKSTSGAWVVYSQPRTKNLRPEIIQYVQQHCQNMSQVEMGLVGGLVNVYHCT